MKTAYPFSKPLYIMAKPAGSLCNMRCKYCYYLEKHNLYKQDTQHIMSDELLEKYVHDYIASQTTPDIMFTWHGGETLLRPISFYERAMELQQKYGRDRRISNSIQTNGTLLTDEWCRFFKRHGWLVGVSIDGPKDIHDTYRHMAGGGPSFDKVMQGINLLKKHGVEWNGMAVVNNLNAERPLEFYRFFKQLGCHYIQFSPIVERTVERADGLTLAPGMEEGGELTTFSITPEQWGRFLCTIFDEWVRHDVARYYVQIFDATLANWVGVSPGLCSLARECGHAGVMEYNGDIYACDHFVYPEYLLGNLHDKNIHELMNSPRQREFAKFKHQSLPSQCLSCKFEFACHGECPKNRFVRDANGEPGLNYLCRGYHAYFEHVAPAMEFMKRELEAGRAPANVMEWVRRG